VWLSGPEQLPKALPSTWHWKDEFRSDEVKLNVTVDAFEVEPFATPEVIVVRGGVTSRDGTSLDGPPRAAPAPAGTTSAVASARRIAARPPLPQSALARVPLESCRILSFLPRAGGAA
jgi:hypothetical protein